MALSTYTYEQLGFGTELGPLTEKEKYALEKSWAAFFASGIFPYIDGRESCRKGCFYRNGQCPLQ